MGDEHRAVIQARIITSLGRTRSPALISIVWRLSSAVASRFVLTAVAGFFNPGRSHRESFFYDVY